MLGIESIALMFLFIALNLIFLFIKRKVIELTVLHFIVMAFTVVISISLIIPDNALIGIFVCVLSVVAWFFSLFMTEVK